MSRRKLCAIQRTGDVEIVSIRKEVIAVASSDDEKATFPRCHCVAVSR